MRMPERLPCPCGTEIAPVAWKKRTASYLYRLRCQRCGLMSMVSSARDEAAVERWNEAVILKRDLRRRGAER
jgi:hypothetical protein